MIYHVIILLTILTDNLVAGLRKESSNNNFFSLIVNISNTSHLEFYYPLHLNKKLFKTLFLNFTYIYSKCKKVRYVYPLSEQSIYLSNPMRQLPSFSIFGHVTIIKRQGTRGPQDLLLGKNSFFSLYPSERYCQSPNTPLTQAFNSLRGSSGQTRRPGERETSRQSVCSSSQCIVKPRNHAKLLKIFYSSAVLVILPNVKVFQVFFVTSVLLSLGGTPGNAWWGRAARFKPTKAISTPVFRPGL